MGFDASTHDETGEIEDILKKIRRVHRYTRRIIAFDEREGLDDPFYLP